MGISAFRVTHQLCCACETASFWKLLCSQVLARVDNLKGVSAQVCSVMPMGLGTYHSVLCTLYDVTLWPMSTLVILLLPILYQCLLKHLGMPLADMTNAQTQSYSSLTIRQAVQPPRLLQKGHL